MTIRTLTDHRRNGGSHLPFGEKRDGLLYGQHILSVRQFTRADLEAIFADIRARQVEVGDRLIRLEPRGPEQNDIQAASGRPVTNA